MEEVLRIAVFQNSANYKKEETIENKMTYPLPPFSTVIGALHNACGYKEYHPMELSIQGKYESLIRKPYTDYCFLNLTQDDRGILVKMKNADMLSTAYDKVAIAKKSQGNSFRLGTTIQVINESLLQEYRDLKDLNDQIKEFKDTRIKPVMELIKRRKKTLANEKKAETDKKSARFILLDKREKEIKLAENEINQRLKEYEEINYKVPISRFRTLTTSLKFYEILTNVELIIHVKSNRETLEYIKEHIYDLKSIGRSEDFVEVKDVCFTKLQSVEEEVVSDYAAYVDYNLVKEYDVDTRIRKGISANGTKYYLNKNYTIVGNKRRFEKKKVIYMSGFSVDEGSNVYLDIIDENKKYIVNFL